MADSPMKVDDGLPHKAGYKSYKKKYRKMRITFEQKMQEGEEIFRQEAKANATVKRLAIENDRLLDILLEINNSTAIPSEKRFDVSLPPPADSKTPILPLDEEHEARKTASLKRLEDLLVDVPHLSYTSAKETNADLVKELDKADNELYPAHFLSANDVDDYIHLIDAKLEPNTHFPTLAPLAHPSAHPPLHPLLKNPNSATSWLRRNAPHIFLQGPHETDTHDDAGGAGAGAGGAGGSGGGDGGDGTAGEKATSSRKSKGGKGERSKAARPSKRTSAIKAAAVADKSRDWDVSMDDDPEFASTPVPKGKRKRTGDDDAGYRPKGSGSRPTKKKRKSEGATDGTPTVRKGKKETAAAAAAASTAAEDD